MVFMSDLERERLILEMDASSEEVDVDAVTKLLATHVEDVFALNSEGTAYTKPASLRGTPIDKIDETSKYWDRDWASLDRYLDHEAEEERLKHEAQRKLRIHGDTPAHRKELKIHQDNVSKHRKIRSIFGKREGYHPNQLVSRDLLPPGGLCDQETMYHLACKVSEFQFLASKELLEMGPWDFIRWRIGNLLIKRRRNPTRMGRNSDLKTVIRNIISKRSDDPLFRQAILYSARLSGRGNVYRKKKKPGKTPPALASNNSSRRSSVYHQRRLSTSSSMIATPSKSPKSPKFPKSGMELDDENSLRAKARARKGIERSRDRARTGAGVKKNRRPRPPQVKSEHIKAEDIKAGRTKSERFA